MTLDEHDTRTVRDALADLLDLAPDPSEHPHLRVATDEPVGRGPWLATAASVTAIAGLAGAAWLLVDHEPGGVAGSPTAPGDAEAPAPTAATTTSLSMGAIVAATTTSARPEIPFDTTFDLATPTTLAVAEPILVPGMTVANPELIPTYLPPGFQLTLVRPGYQTVAQPGLAQVVLGRRADGVLDVVRAVATNDLAAWPLPTEGDGTTRESITAGDVTAEVFRDANGWATVALPLAAGYVTVSGHLGEDDALLAGMIEVAGAATWAGDALAFSTLPSGWDVLADSAPAMAPATTVVNQTGHGVSTWLAYASDPRLVDQLSVGVTHDPEPGALWFGSSSPATPVEVRCHEGFVTVDSLGGGRPDGVTLRWLERPDLLVEVSAKWGPGLGDVMAAAESLVPISDAEWVRLVDAATTQDVASTTSTVAPLTGAAACPSSGLATSPGVSTTSTTYPTTD